MLRNLVISLWLLLSFTAPNAIFANNNPDAELLFAKRILPMLQEKCVACHGADASKVAGGLDLQTAEALILLNSSEFLYVP